MNNRPFLQQYKVMEITKALNYQIFVNVYVNYIL